MRDDNIQKYLNDLRNGDFLAAVDLSQYIAKKYHSSSAVDIMRFTEYELCKTDIDEKDLGKLNFLLEFIGQYYPEGSEAFCLSNICVSAITVIDMKKHPEFSSVINKTNNKEDILNSDFPRLKDDVIKVTAKKNNTLPFDPNTYLKDEIAKMTNEEKNNLIKNIFALRKKYDLSYSMFEYLVDMNCEDKYVTLLQKIERHINFPIVATNYIQKIEDAGFIAQKIPSIMLELIAKNSIITEEQKNKELTLYDIAIQFGQLDVANTLAKKYEQLMFSKEIDGQPSKEFKHLMYCNRILDETSKLRKMGEQMILKLAHTDSQRHALNAAFTALQEHRIDVDRFKKEIAPHIKIGENHPAFKVMQKADSLNKLINEYKIKDISASSMNSEDFKARAKEILKSDDIPLKSTRLTRILERIRNAINRSPEYLSSKQQDKINSALNSAPNQKEMRAFLKQMRKEESEQHKLATSFLDKNIH